MENGKPLFVSVAVTGVVFAHPGNSFEIHQWAKASGNYPYQHLYQGDNVAEIVSQLRSDEAEMDDAMPDFLAARAERRMGC